LISDHLHLHCQAIQQEKDFAAHKVFNCVPLTSSGCSLSGSVSRCRVSLAVRHPFATIMVNTEQSIAPATQGSSAISRRDASEYADRHRWTRSTEILCTSVADLEWSAAWFETTSPAHPTVHGHGGGARDLLNDRSPPLQDSQTISPKFQGLATKNIAENHLPQY
jgi:hypothetical protein